MFFKLAKPFRAPFRGSGPFQHPETPAAAENIQQRESESANLNPTLLSPAVREISNSQISRHQQAAFDFCCVVLG
jgi:hypothetical protein